MHSTQGDAGAGFDGWGGGGGGGQLCPLNGGKGSDLTWLLFLQNLYPCRFISEIKQQLRIGLRSPCQQLFYP